MHAFQDSSFDFAFFICLVVLLLVFASRCVSLSVGGVWALFRTVGLAFLLRVAAFCWKNASAPMLSVSSASAYCTEQVLWAHYFEDQVGNRFFSSFSPSKMFAFLFENTTLGPPKPSLAFFAWLFFSKPKSQGATLEPKK